MPSPDSDPFSAMPPPSSVAPIIPEMTILREWENKHEQELEEEARKEAREKEEKRKAAELELQQWQTERKENITKRIAQNREDVNAREQARIDALKPGANPWECVADLIDLKAATTTDETRTDTSRMRSLLIQLKSTPVIPKA